MVSGIHCHHVSRSHVSALYRFYCLRPGATLREIPPLPTPGRPINHRILVGSARASVGWCLPWSTSE